MKKLNELQSYLTRLRGLMLTLIILCSIGVGNVWGVENDTHDFTQTLSQLLNNNASIADVTVTEQSYTVKSVIVTVKYNKTAGGATVSVKVGGTTFGSAQTINSNTTKTFTYDGASAVKGQVVVSSVNNCSSGTGKGTFKITNVRLVEGPAAAPAYTITATRNNDSYGTVEVSGTTITATPKTGYRVIAGDGGYSVKSGTATVVNNGDNTFTVTPSSNCTVQINFEAIPTYTVTLKDDGDTRTQASAGASVTLPSREGCTGYTFAGWTKTWVTAQTEWTTTAPTIIPAGSYTPTANENLYPVYTKEEGGGSSTASSKSISSTSTSAVTLETSKPITYTCSASNTYSNPARIYKDNSITIAGGTITSISLTGVSNYAISNMTANTGTLTPDGNNGTWTGSASSVKFTASTGQTRISAISVTYAGGSTTSYISEANCCSLQAATSVRVTSVAATSVTLGWTAPSPATEITKLQVVDGNGTVKVDNLAANATSATVTGLTECESYSFHIVSVGSSCNVSSASVPAQPYSGAKTVTYNYHEGTGSPASFTTDCSHTSTTLPTPTRANYRFDGWYTSASGGTRKGGGGDNYTPDATIELHAQWTRVYTVSYDYAGGSGSCVAGGPYAEGETVTTCAAPTRSGYTFNGWSDGVTTYNAGSTISNVQNDIVLTAQWTADTYAITYNGVKPGAENNNPTSYTVEDLPINLVAATHDQWRFDGWTDDNAGNADITTIPAGTTGNQSFTAHWTKRYAVTWYEESTPTIEYYDPGTTLQFPADPSAPASCSEKKFVGWMVGTIEGETDDKPTFITAGEVNADAAYHAVWANSAGSAIAAVEDNTFIQSDVSKATYCGVGNGLQSVGKYVQNQSIWNASQMTGVNVKIKVYHVSNNRADVLRISLINSSGEEVVGTDLTTSKLGNSSSFAGYSSNVTLTPTTAVTGYKVSLKTKNSSGTSVGKVTREVVPAYSKYSTSCCDNNVAAPSVTATATRNSITLSWANVTGATGYKVTINGGTHDVTTAACTYTASGLNSGTDYAWTVIATYNPANYCGAIPTKNTTTTLSVYGVTYNKNTTIGSGTVTMSPMPSDASTYVVGENVTAAAKPTTCTNSGYTFNGWNTEPDGTGTHVDAGGTIAMVEGGLTLYAEWVAKRAYYVDRMHGQGDQTIEIGGKTYHCYYGDGYHITPSPSDQKSGDACQAPHYRFVRWLTIGHINADGTQKDTGGAVGGGVQRGTVTDGETYYAIWEEEIE